MTEREEQELLTSTKLQALKEEIQKRVCDWANEHNVNLYLYVEMPMSTGTEQGYMCSSWTPDNMCEACSKELEKRVLNYIADGYMS